MDAQWSTGSIRTATPLSIYISKASVRPFPTGRGDGTRLNDRPPAKRAGSRAATHFNRL